MTWLQITSFLFSTITIHAYYVRATEIFFISLFLCLFNLWYHTTYYKVISWITTFVSVYYFTYTSLTLLVTQNPLVLCVFIIVFTYYNMAIAYSPELKMKWHMILHFHVIMLSHFYLWWSLIPKETDNCTLILDIWTRKKGTQCPNGFMIRDKYRFYLQYGVDLCFVCSGIVAFSTVISFILGRLTGSSFWIFP